MNEKVRDLDKAGDVKSTSNRYHVLDMIRGICIILVVLYHMVFDYVVLMKEDLSFINNQGLNLFRDAFAGTLVFLAGVCCNLSRSNIKRGVKTLFCGMGITGVTALIMPRSKVIFGILHLLGVAMILYGFLGNLLEKLPVILGFTFFLLMHMLTLGVYNGYFGWQGLYTVELPEMPGNLLLFILGFNTGHGSGDYWPIMPWIFLFFAGIFIGRLFKAEKVPRWFRANPVPPLAYIGRKSLAIYLIHQPVVYVLMLMLYVIGNRNL